MKDHVCKQCGKAYFDKNALNSHINVIHLNLREFICEQCGDTFGRKQSLKAHEKGVHLKIKLRQKPCRKVLSEADDKLGEAALTS